LVQGAPLSDKNGNNVLKNLQEIKPDVNLGEKMDESDEETIAKVKVYYTFLFPI